MLDVLNAVYLGAMMVASVNLYFDEDYKLAGNLDSIVEVSAHREWWREDGNGKCSFKGALVPFARDWEEVDESTYPPITRPATPDEIAGQAMIVSKKVCKTEAGEVVTPMFSAGLMWRTYTNVHAKGQVLVKDMSALKPEDKPEWLPGVLARIERLAETDASARAFLVDLSASVAALASQAEVQQNAAPSESAPQN